MFHLYVIKGAAIKIEDDYRNPWLNKFASQPMKLAAEDTKLNVS
jgi:hypothetical protein